MGAYLALQAPELPGDDENPHLIMAVGNGDVWLVDEGENISAGDCLISSSTAGHARKDPGTHLTTNVIARASENIDWSTVTETAANGKKHKKIMVLFESFERRNYSEVFTFTGDQIGATDAQSISLSNIVTDADSHRLSLTNELDEEIAYFGNNGDVAIKGRLFLSDRGTMQSNRYIYYDGSVGAGGDFIRTNAAGWSTGSYDFAEMFPSNDDLEPGELVMIDVNSTTKVKRADNSLESNGYMLSGIVSTRPGFLAGMNEAYHFPVALQGRVPTRVNLENGPIKIGDPITISSEPGVGMRTEAAGYVVGIALEPYDGTQSDNLITVFLKNGWFNGLTIEQPNLDVSDNLTSSLSAVNGIVDMGGHPIIGIGALEGIDGLWSIDGNGKLTAKEIEADQIQTDELTVKADDTKTTIGEGVIPVESSTYSVENPAVKFNSRIFVTFFGNIEGSWWISDRTDGRFVIVLSALAKTDIPFEYWILDVADERSAPGPQPDPPPVEPPAEDEPTSDSESELTDEPATDGDAADDDSTAEDEPEAEDNSVTEPPAEEETTEEEVTSDEDSPAEESPAETEDEPVYGPPAPEENI
jgi:hypothetical protein